MAVELGRPTELLPRNKFKPLSSPVFLLMWFKKKKKVYFILQLSGHPSLLRELRAGAQKGRNPEVAAKAEVMERYCLLVCFPEIAEPAFFMVLRITNPGGGTSHSESAPPMSIANQENTSQVYTQVSLVGLCSQLRLLLPKWLWLVSSWQKS